jgi:YesN/AraC family two-component response regulator
VEKKNLLPAMVKYLLKEEISHGDLHAAQETLNDIIKKIFVAGNSYLNIQFLTIDLLHLLIELSDQFNIQLNQDSFIPLLSFDKVTELYKSFLLITGQLCGEIQKDARIQKKKLDDSVLSFIHANYRNQSLSLEFVADMFNLPDTKISSAIRENTGYGFAQYVGSLRMNEVKRLLVESDMNIQDIVHSVGYMDLPNFVRKFRKQEGLTPGQYRALKKPPEAGGSLPPQVTGPA